MVSAVLVVFEIEFFLANVVVLKHVEYQGGRNTFSSHEIWGNWRVRTLYLLGLVHNVHLLYGM